MKRAISIMKQTISIGVIVGPALFFGIIGKTAEMGLMVVASSIAVAFLNIDQIKSFKGAGFEAQMKDVINEAYTTIDSLKEMSKPLIVSTLNDITWSGRLSGIDQEQKHNLKDDIEAIISKFDIKDKKAASALKNNSDKLPKGSIGERSYLIR